MLLFRACLYDIEQTYSPYAFLQERRRIVTEKINRERFKQRLITRKFYNGQVLLAGEREPNNRGSW